MESGRSGEACRAGPSVSVPVESQVGIRRSLTRSVWAMSTLAARIAHRDSAAFVGRARELRVVDELLADGGVLLVHGAGGVGKSVLLREIRRRAAGWEPFVVDGRDLPPVPDAIEQALAGAWSAERPLILIDTYDRMSALGGYLRSTLLPSLPANAAVVIAGRETPEPGWFEGGWETVAVELPLAALSEFEARALLVRQGLRDDPRAAAITRWAGGLPLALRLGAAAAREDPTWAPGSDAAPLRAHLQRVSEVALAGEHADVFALACVARVVTPALVADVLPGVDPAAALRWLAGCAFADSRPGGVTLHELVRRPLRATLEPERERSLRARVADSLHARALDDLTLTIDLADLVEDPAVRAGYSWDGGVDHHVTGPGPERLAPDAATQAFFDSEPGHVLVARDAEGEPCGYAIAFGADTSSALAHADPRLGRWLAHARGREAIVWRDSVSHPPARAGAAQHGHDPALRLAQSTVRIPADRSSLAIRAGVQRRGRGVSGARTRSRRLGVPRARLRAGRAARRAARPRPARARSRGAGGGRARGAAQSPSPGWRRGARAAAARGRAGVRRPRPTSSCCGAC